MQCFTEEAPFGCFDADGKLAQQVHPESGHAFPVIVQDCTATVDGEVRPGVFFDEEAGLALLFGEETGSFQNEYGYRIPCRPLKVVHGEVRVKVHCPAECPCRACSPQNY